MENHPDDVVKCVLACIDREQFLSWTNDPGFWDAFNREIERRSQILMTLLPSANEGYC